MKENKPESTKIIPLKETATFFKTQDDFRTWLESHFEKETELIVGFYKVNSGKPSMKAACKSALLSKNIDLQCCKK